MTPDGVAGATKGIPTPRRSKPSMSASYPNTLDKLQHPVRLVDETVVSARIFVLTA
jgi:hypothetical protein